MLPVLPRMCMSVCVYVCVYVYVCTGGCCSGVWKAVGVVMVLTPNTTGCAFVEPAALTPQ